MGLPQGRRNGSNRHAADRDAVGPGTQGRRRRRLRPSLPKGGEQLVLAGQQPPLASLHGHQSRRWGFLRRPALGDLPGQAKGLCGLARQAIGKRWHGQPPPRRWCSPPRQGNARQARRWRRRQGRQALQGNGLEVSGLGLRQRRTTPAQQGGGVIRQGGTAPAAGVRRGGAQHLQHHELAEQGGQQGRAPAPQARISQPGGEWREAEVQGRGAGVRAG